MMKTTLEIPDEIYREIKMRAAQERMTMTKIITSALAAALNRPIQSEPAGAGSSRKKRTPQKITGWMKKEAPFLESMRGPVYGRGAVEDLIEGRR